MPLADDTTTDSETMISVAKRTTMEFEAQEHMDEPMTAEAQQRHKLSVEWLSGTVAFPS